MEKITEVFFNWQVLLLSFGTFVILSIVKRLGTKTNGDKKVTGGFAHHGVFKTILPILPYPIAIGLMFIPGMPLPEVVEKTPTLAVKIMFGMYCGWLSDKAFQIIKEALEKMGVKFPSKD